MKSSRLKPLIFLAIPLAVGGLAALFSAGSMDKFSALNQPPLSPPGWLFPIVWGILYILMGTASYIVYSSDAPEISKQKALGLYLVQLGFNFLWPILFFTFGLCTGQRILPGFVPSVSFPLSALVQRLQFWMWTLKRDVC